MRFIRILIVAAVLGIFAGCTGDHHNSDPNTPPSSETPTLLASGGIGTNGMGGAGGYVDLESYGSVKVLKSGTVDASFPDPGFSPALANFGTVHATVNSDTTVLLDSDDVSGNLCSASWDNSLYIGDGNGTCGDVGDSVVTGLTVNAGATLFLVDPTYSGYGTLRLTNDLVINGTLTTDMNATSGLDMEANIIDVESGGKITVSATTMDWSAGEIWLGNGNGTTNQIINRGTIEAKGLGTGSGGWIVLEPNDLVVNYGTIDASGGDSTDPASSGGSGGSGGELDVYVDYGDFYSSGIVRMNGGKGATDGGYSEAEWCNYNCYSVYVETTYNDNTGGRNGDIIISGTWEANGGDATNGWGGYGGYIYLQTDALGAVTINATMSTKGGDSSGAGFPGGGTYGIDIYSYLDPFWCTCYNDPLTPGKISIAGQYDLSGGDGDESGGGGGYFEVYAANNTNGSGMGSDMELVLPSINLNGGQGASGGSASGQAFEIYTYSDGNPAGAITNEAYIEAKGGKATVAGNQGGSGGYVEMAIYGIGDPTEIINNSGIINISGGIGDIGGWAYGGGFGDALHLEAQNVTNSGNLTVNGGNGTTSGGNGGNITLYSQDTNTPTVNTGALSVAGGSPGGSNGSIYLDGAGPI